MGPGGFFPASPDLADILGDMDLDFESFYFLDLLDPYFPDFQVPNFHISRFPDLQIPRFQDFQTPLTRPDATDSEFPDASVPILRSQPEPSSEAPRDQKRLKEPLLQSR